MQGRGREEKAPAQETRRGVNVSVNGKEDLADAPRSLVHAEFHLFSGSPLSCASLLELLVPYTIPIAQLTWSSTS
jgi:hypothetical protein